MPFADVQRPAIGVSLLQAATKARGLSSTIEYCNIPFADTIGRDLYGTISHGTRPQHLVGEWVFADDVFGDEIPPAEEYMRRVLVPNVASNVADRIVSARVVRGEYLDRCVAQIMAHAPRVVGFTTTFHQTCASLAVAKRLKDQPQPPAIAFGGANCEGEMGVQMLESFPWIDAVSSGESDTSFPRMLDALLEGRTARIAGVAFRDQASDERVPGPLAVYDMDALPIPDYDDYFRQLDESVGGRDAGAHVVVETSRGCWWGAKHHCTFCGLNGDTMAFRAKDPQRAYEEIICLAERYDSPGVESVDNILDLRYLDTLLPMLAESDLDLRFFYEVKANLRYEQLRKMRAGGIRHVQPGIESLSNQVLRLMDKGVTRLQNIQLMRWCEEFDIRYTWNILAGFPGEEPDEYRRMAELIPLLTHLTPPASTAQLRLDRFSPYHTNSERFGFRNVRPSLAYSLVFPLAADELQRLAYYFDYDYADNRSPRTYLEPMRDVLAAWHEARGARLDAEAVGDTIVVTDTRRVARKERHELVGVEAQVYLACDSATTSDALLRRPEFAGHESAVQEALDELAEQCLLVSDEGRHVSLAVFRARPSAGAAEAAERADRAVLAR
jgi:ribosomal peptide maturation radical SAM protein 1